MGKAHEFVVLIPACVPVETAGPASMSDAPHMHMLSMTVGTVHTVFEVRYLLSEQQRHCWL